MRFFFRAGTKGGEVGKDVLHNAGAVCPKDGGCTGDVDAVLLRLRAVEQVVEGGSVAKGGAFAYGGVEPLFLAVRFIRVVVE